MELYKEIIKAEERIRPHILKTPLFHSVHLSQLNGGSVYLKLESEQYTGSFKARGAMNKVLKTPREKKRNGLITASTGNHALGFARALSITGDNGIIYLPENAVPSKVEALKEYGTELHFQGESCLESELYAKQIAKENNMVWVSPYNDTYIMAGQGTVGVEITEQMEEAIFISCVAIPVRSATVTISLVLLKGSIINFPISVNEPFPKPIFSA